MVVVGEQEVYNADPEGHIRVRQLLLRLRCR